MLCVFLHELLQCWKIPPRWTRGHYISESLFLDRGYRADLVPTQHPWRSCSLSPKPSKNDFAFRCDPCTSCDQEGPGLNTLVVITDSPLIWRTASSSSATSVSTAEHRPQEVTSHVSGLERSEPYDRQAGRGISEVSRRGYERANKKQSPFSFDSPGRSRNAPPSWSAHPREAAALLSLLFSWANGGGDDDERPGHQTAHVKRGAQDTDSDVVKGSKARDLKASSSDSSAPNAAASGRGKPGRSFTIVCPATRVRMNIETYVKDSDTGRVAVQWCLASKNAGEKGRT